MAYTETERYYSHLCGEIMSLLEDHKRPVAPELPIFEKEFKEKNIELCYCNYFIWKDIITKDGVHLDRILDTISYFVKSEDFKYKKDNNPEGLVFTLAASTYWLREAIFDPKAFKYEVSDPKISRDYQKLNLAKYYDIASVLIKKGFNFKISFDNGDGSPMNPYADFYLKQCLKRNRKK